MKNAPEFFATRDFRLILKNEFAKKKLGRPAYSLGSFARDIGLTNSRLNAIFKEKHGISGERAKAIAEKLKFTKEEAEFFVALVESQHSRTQLEKKQAQRRLARFIKTNEGALTNQELHLLDKWYYPATLHFVKSQNGKVSVTSVAKALRLTNEQAQDALSFLVKSGELHFEKNEYKFSQRFSTGNSVLPNPTIQNFHAQFLEQLKNSIFREPMLKRKNRSTYLVFDSARVDEARVWLENMHAKFLDEFGVGENGDSVFSFGVYLSRIDQQVKQ